MAKLRHLQDMIQRIANVDEARARVLVMKARAEGHFTTGGRGVNAPDMVPADAASALLLCLHLDGPTEAGAALDHFKTLPLDHIEHDPGDGTFRHLDEENEVFPRVIMDALGQANLQDLGAALEALFSRADAFANRFDRVSLKRTGQGEEVVIEIADAEYSRGGWPEGPRAWKVVFSPAALSPYDGLACWTEKTVHVEALRALRDLVLTGAD